MNMKHSLPLFRKWAVGPSAIPRALRPIRLRSGQALEAAAPIFLSSSGGPKVRKGFLVALILALLAPCRIAGAISARLPVTGLTGVLPAAAAAPVPVWRFWSPVLGKHFYTLDADEKDWLLANYSYVWTYEDVAYRAFASWDDPGLAPVHRFWSQPLGAHFYTVDENERDWLLANYSYVWTYEGVGFYAYPAGRQPAGTMPVHRFWSSTLGAHFYTISDREQFSLRSGYPSVWQYEGVAWYAYPPEAAAPAAIVKGPYVQQTTTDAATILWETDIPCESQVEYGRTAPGEWAASDPALVTRHQVALSGLEAGALYSYEVSSGGTVSPPGSFTTAPSADQPFRFAVYGDSRTDSATHAQVVRSIGDSGPALVFHVGDLVSSGTDYALWQTEFFAPARELMMTTPVVPVLGNHEYAGTGPRWFFYFFDQPFDEGWWALTYGNIRFLGLDTNVAYTAGSPQRTWLMQELTSSTYADATWHVVLFHHPAFTCTATHSDTDAVRDYLVPLLEQYGVDLVFQGHSHLYERYENNGIYYIVTGGGGAPLYSLAPDLVPPIRQFGLSAYHHCTVDVDPAGGSLILRAIDISGRVFDTVSLSKAP
jgi:3',5'-cyclic AMP phosphodiesterase CpdA